jgi:hypothetical protein
MQVEGTMALLKRKIAERIKGALQEKEDWWHLCYDTVTREFSVEHSWHHLNAYKVVEKANEGRTVVPVADHDGIGADKIEAARAELLAEAGHN